MNAFLTGLEQARQGGQDLSRIHSVASFFVSRVDTEVDRRLDDLGTPEAARCRGKAGIANARLAYHAYEEVFSTPRWASLEAEGAHKQRPLWASTGVKDPAYRDTMYVEDLVAPNTVNTMPTKTLQAVADHGEINGDQVTGRYDEARGALDALGALGIPYADVVAVLEREGVDKFAHVLGRPARQRPGRARQGDASESDARSASASSPPDRRRTPSPGTCPTWSRRASPASCSTRTPRCGARRPRPRRPSGWPGSAWVGPHDPCSARWTPCVPTCLNRASTTSSCAAWAAPRWPRGHLRHGRRRAHRAGLLPPGPGADRADRPARPHGRRGLEQVRLHGRDGLPASRLRGCVPRAGIDPTQRIVIVTDPGSPLDKDARAAGYRVINADPLSAGATRR